MESAKLKKFIKNEVNLNIKIFIIWLILPLSLTAMEVDLKDFQHIQPHRELSPFQYPLLGRSSILAYKRYIATATTLPQLARLKRGLIHVNYHGTNSEELMNLIEQGKRDIWENLKSQLITLKYFNNNDHRYNDINEEGPDGTLLQLIAINGDASLLKLFLENGAAPNALSRGRTALHEAISTTGNIDVIKTLLAYKADPNIKTTLSGSTVLHLVVHNYNRKKIEELKILIPLLLQYNADISIEDSNGFTPYTIARDHEDRAKYGGYEDECYYWNTIVRLL